MLLYVTCAVLGLIIFVWQRRRHLSIHQRNNIPGPPPSFFSGNLWDIYKHGHLKMLSRWHKQYGPVVGYYFGMKPVVVCADPEHLKTILLKEFHNFADRSDLVSGGPVGGLDSALTVLRGQRWKDVRSTLTPSFTSRKLKQLNPEVCSIVDGFLKNIDTEFANSNEFNIYELYQALTLETICKTGMGVDFGIQEDIKNSKILDSSRLIFTQKFNLVGVIIISFPILWPILGKLITALRLRAQNEGINPVDDLKKKCADVVKLRRANPENHRVDLLQLMIDAQKTEKPTSDDDLIAGDVAEEKDRESNEAAANVAGSECPFSGKSRGLTDDEVIDNAFLILLAGFETTSSSLAFITKMLLRFPEVQEKLRQELLEATDRGKRFDFEKLQKCHYMEAVIQEVLRMYPPVFFFTTREAKEDIVIDDFTIPKGMGTFASTDELHHNEDIFPDPYKFRPERFLPENKTSAMSWAWQPFGAGPRNCIGMRFAQMEIKITLAKLLTKYVLSSRLEPLNDEHIETDDFPVTQRVGESLLCKVERVQLSPE
ncbi:cytochrome P450 3A31 [Galendromus occidentalis]|uniref:Cytochrome P450 3A31 n=1 Tax=Galendromus occidentalis TaxID=34638 RepID=A0AAJ7WHY8_9ACAR|nr:cytochrome P450 3A31 [Galendromus occidentalis]